MPRPLLRAKPLIKQNLKLFLEDLFLRDGFYDNISVGETNVYGNDISLLQPAALVYQENDPSFPQNNRVYQSAFKNWVHEDGIPAPSGFSSPVVASGVTVAGTFYPTSSGDPGYNSTYAHKIDSPNGRVIFDTPLAGSPIVQAEFSYKTIWIDGASSFNNEKNPLLIETAYKDNPRETGVDIYPTPQSRTLPAIWIDVLSRQNSGYELGTRTPVKDFFGVFHIWARDSITIDLLEDVIGDEFRTVLLGIDFNTAPDPLLVFGQKNSNFPGYSTLANEWGPHFWHRIYLENLTANKDTPLYEVERSRMDFNIRVYPNF